VSNIRPVVLNTKPFRPTDFNAKAVQEVLDESYLIVDVKKDGVRLNLIVGPEAGEGNSVDWLSREGKGFPAMLEGSSPLDCDPRWAKFFNPNLGEAMFREEGFMLDAELILLSDDGEELPCKNTSGNLARKGDPVATDKIRVYVFDILPLDVVLSGKEYEVFTSVRKMHVEYQVTKLKEFFPEIDWRVAESFDVFSMDPCEPLIVQDEEGNEIPTETPLSLTEVYNAVRERGEEGLVIKSPMGNYRRSKVTGWWKMVPDDNEDGIIQGLVWGTPGKANEGKVIGFEVLLESGHVVNACKISRKLMDEFTDAVFKAAEDHFVSRGIPLYPNKEDFKPFMDPSFADTVNPYKGHTAKVTFMERYPDGSLRHPSFDSFRGISSPFIKE
jgi:ATP-dependent DNA ligase